MTFAPSALWRAMTSESGPTSVMRSPSMTTVPPKTTSSASFIVTRVPFLMMIALAHCPRSLSLGPQRPMPCPACGTADVRSTQTDFDFRYGSSASAPSSRPNPECLRPPKGTATSNIP